MCVCMCVCESVFINHIYLRSVLCKDAHKLLGIGLASFGEEPRAQHLSPLSHLRHGAHRHNLSDNATDRAVALTQTRSDSRLLKSYRLTHY